MNINELCDAFGTATQEEVLAACKLAEPSLRNYEEAKTFLIILVQQLVQTHRPRKAVQLIKAAGLSAEFKQMVNHVSTTETGELITKYRHLLAEYVA